MLRVFLALILTMNFSIQTGFTSSHKVIIAPPGQSRTPPKVSSRRLGPPPAPPYPNKKLPPAPNSRGGRHFIPPALRG